MNAALAQLLPANVFAVMLVFCRTGAALMLLPGFGDLYVPQRYRLILAILLAGLVATALGRSLPAAPEEVGRLAQLVLGELLIGVFLGTIARILLGALDTAGMIISFQLGLSAAQVFNPALAQQGAITGAFVTVLGVLVIFLTNTHHLLLRGLVGSYELFPPGGFPVVGDLSDTVAHIVGISFRLAVELSAPVIVIGTVFYVAMGLLSRLMPQLQIFFVILPVQIVGGLLVFSFTLYAVMSWFLGGFTAALGPVMPL
ncbi:MAG: flagellar type III secretion system protein FliR [Alphaproteobacteria bacterium]|nr:flagellar type III secretion system protein FliR [Alphaproteobacteria bacterium]